MTYNIGDPNHLGVHNDLATEVEAMADEIGVDVDLPGQKDLGDTGHVADHNMIASAIDKVAQAIEINSGPGLAELVGPIVGTGTRHEFDEGGVTFYAFECLSSCTITVNSAGFIPEILLIGGGGGGGGSYSAGGGGSGGYTNITQAYFSASTHGVVIGESGIGGSEYNNSKAGQASLLGSYVGIGGGHGATYSLAGGDGGSGGGDSFNNFGGGSSIGGQGNKGGSAVAGAGAGGGGSAAAGADASTSNVATAGGAGASSSITGSAVNRGAGGGGGSDSAPASGGIGGGGDGTAGGTANAGEPNSGSGGGGSSTLSGIGGAGGSGVVILKIQKNYARSAYFTDNVTMEARAEAEAARVAEETVARELYESEYNALETADIEEGE